MALRKRIVLDDTGVTVEYWKIVQVSGDMFTGIVGFTVGGFVNEEARREGKRPAASFSFIVNLDELDLDKNWIAQLYGLLKEGKVKTTGLYGQEEDFTLLEGAEDC